MLPVTEIIEAPCDPDSGAGEKDWIKHPKLLKRWNLGQESNKCVLEMLQSMTGVYLRAQEQEIHMITGNNCSALLEDGNS